MPGQHIFLVFVAVLLSSLISSVLISLFSTSQSKFVDIQPFVAEGVRQEFHKLQRLSTTGPNAQDVNSRLSIMEKKMQTVKAENKQLQNIVGTLLCKSPNVDHVPSGGFCLAPKGVKSYPFDKTLAKEMLENLFEGKSLADFGARIGLYAQYFKDSGRIKSVNAYDAAPNVEEITDEFVQFADLSLPQFFPQVDWVYSIEVGEHIPKASFETFLDNIDRTAKEGVVLTWAIPNQPGVGHVNCLPNDVIKQKMSEHGFVSDEAMEVKFRKAATLSWLKNTIMVFRRKEM